jgi:SAM-dependent methyltransferase/uncharacterized protein YbaR (Trm112 family)
MRLRHFAALRPQCPICRRDRGALAPLSIASVIRREGDVIVEGVLLCPNPACQREYPILDGIPIIVAGLRDFLAQNLFQAMMRDDLSETIESILGDCSGPASLLDAVRHQLSCYAWDHYGLHDAAEPAPSPHAPRPGAAVRVLESGLDLAAAWPEGPIVDLGCSVGGTTFALAERTDRLVVGIDLNLAMLRLASTALLRGEVRYPRKRTGVVYDQRRFPVRFARAENVDFWACDVAALPFADETFAVASMLNLIDCVRAPRDLLAEAARVLAPGGKAVITSPYDWSAVATPIETWLGGHSQRGPGHGGSAAVLRALLTPGGLSVESEIDEVSWHVRLHDRSTVGYTVHLVVAKKTPGAHLEPTPSSP